jgi:hypothetical protein
MTSIVARAETSATQNRAAANRASPTSGWDWIHVHARLSPFTTAQR